MTESASGRIAAGGLVAGSVLGMAGTFVPSAPIRGLLWGMDGIALVVATALLAIYYVRKGDEIVSAGFLVFAFGETLIVSSAAMDLAASTPVFGAGAGLWAAALCLLSLPKVGAAWVRVIGAIAALLFAVVAVQSFMGSAITPLSQPLPYFAYPFLVASLLGWAWQRCRSAS